MAERGAVNNPYRPPLGRVYTGSLSLCEGRGAVTPFARLRLAIGLLLVVALIGTAGFMLIERWSLLDAFYMTVITLATIGYGEVHPLSDGGRVFAILLIALGVTSVGYAIGSLTETFIEQRFFQDRVRERRMQQSIERLRGHIIICGFGRVGMNAAEELARQGRPFVVIEQRDDLVAYCRRHGYHAVQGDAQEDAALLRAGIEHASAVIAALDTDAANLFLTISCKSLRETPTGKDNPSQQERLTVVARARVEEAEPKLRRAGADRVLYPYRIAGQILADLATAPETTDDAAIIARHKHAELLLEEVIVAEGSSLVGRPVGDATVRGMTEVKIVGRRAGEMLSRNLPPETVIAEGDLLLVIGTHDQVFHFRTFAGQTTISFSPDEDDI